jgi:protein gp37
MAKGSEAGGCLNCYAARTALRWPDSGLAVMRPSGPRWTGKVELVEKHLADPLRWRSPKRVFVNSMSDLFHDALPDEAIDRVFAVMALCPQHTFQVLTKRPDRMLVYVSNLTFARLRIWMNRADGLPDIIRRGIKPLPNVWLGVSCENQATADARIPLLLQTPAAIRFVSYEPALGPVDFTRLSFDLSDVTHELIAMRVARGEAVTRESYENYPKAIWINALTGGNPAAKLPGLDQVIVGGESGPGARPLDIAWARQTVEQCSAASVACFVKQLGSVPVMSEKVWSAASTVKILASRNSRKVAGDQVPIHLNDRKGGSPEEWPEDLRIRQFPEGVS